MTDIFQVAKDELKALVKDSENCANKIISSSENLIKLADGVSDKNLSVMIKSEITKIFEATHFQDFTGQRATKIRELFDEIFEKTGSITQKEKSFEKSLMAGPNVKTASQEEIDKLFNG